MPQRSDQVRVQPGNWHDIVTRLVVNDIGKKNGFIQSWFDGELVLDAYNFEFRDQSCSGQELLIDKMYFCTFFGGRTDEYKPVKDEFACFDDFRLTRVLPTDKRIAVPEERLILKNPQPILSDQKVNNQQVSYGYGIQLNWIVLQGIQPAYYELQISPQNDFPAENSEIRQLDLKTAPEDQFYHFGDIQHANYAHCLPSAQTFFYRMRAFDNTNNNFTDWSNTVSAVVGAYEKLSFTKIEPRLYNTDVSDHSGKYGFGMRLEWTPSVNPKAAFYEIQYTLDKDTANASWLTITSSCPKEQGGWINHHGSEQFVDFVRCLPNEASFSYRIRPLAQDKTPLADWSEPAFCTMINYIRIWKALALFF